jgi:hypothetical protein
MRTALGRLALFTLVLGATCTTRMTHAQTIHDEYGVYGFPHDNKASLIGVAGVTGSAKLEGRSFDLEAGYGVFARYEHPINTFVVLGGSFGMTTWLPGAAADLGADRSLVFDLAFMPKLRLPFSERVELYVAAPVGPCVSIGDPAQFGGTADFAAGWTATGLFGMHLGFVRSAGLVLEAGYSLHNFTHEVIASDGRPRFSVDVSLRQPWFVLGFYARS